MTDETKEPTVILVSANWRTSVVHTALSIATPVAWIGFGVWMGSWALETLGFLGTLVVGIGWIYRSCPTPVTIDDARATLDDLEAAES